MLKIIDKPSFEATVFVNTVHMQGDFKARFVALPGSRIKALEEAAIKAGKGPEGLLFDVCTWFETVDTPTGPLPHDGSQSLEKLLDWPGIGPAMVKSYFRALWEEASGN